MEKRITVEGLRKRYGDRVALAGIDFEVESGEIVGLLGPNGAGKTTTLSILATLLEPDDGAVTVDGHRLPKGARKVRAAIGLVPQQTAIYPTLTATENLRFFARMHGLAGRATADAIAWAGSLVGLESRAADPVETFSSGMRRRLNLACGILHRPRVILLDEPTVGVDPQSRERIYDAIRTLAREGAAVLYSTHDMDEAERLCARVVLLDSGNVIAAGTTEELVSTIGMTPVIQLRTTRALPDGWNADVVGARVLERSGAEMVVAVADAAAVPTLIMSVARAGGDVVDLRLHSPNLADVFFQLTGRALRDDEAASAGPL